MPPEDAEIAERAADQAEAAAEDAEESAETAQENAAEIAPATVGITGDALLERIDRTANGLDAVRQQLDMVISSVNARIDGLEKWREEQSTESAESSETEAATEAPLLEVETQTVAEPKRQNKAKRLRFLKRRKA